MVVLNNKAIREYYNYVKSQKTLSLKELDDLLKKDDKVSKQKFVNAYLYYVFVYAYQIYNYFTKYLEIDYSFEDFLQDGNLLLLSIIDRPRAKNNISLFSLYYWSTLKMVLERKISNNKANLTLYNRLCILKSRDDFFRINQREATINELVTLTKLSKNLVEAALLEPTLDIENLSENKINYLIGSYEVEEYVIDKIIQEKDCEIINQCLSDLTEKRRIIIEKFYGINENDEKSLSEIGEELNISKQCAHEMKNRSLKKLYKKNKSLLDLYHQVRF